MTNAPGTRFNVFSEAGFNALAEDARCGQYEQCLNCGACLGPQREFCDDECASEFAANNPDNDWGV